jgi:hypothetical protein
MHKLLTLLGFCLFITIYWLANAYINHVELEKRYELEQKRCLPSEPKPFNREGFKTFNFHGTWLQLNTEKFFLGPHKKNRKWTLYGRACPWLLPKCISKSEA